MSVWRGVKTVDASPNPAAITPTTKPFLNYLLYFNT